MTTPLKHGIGSDHFSAKVRRDLLNKGVRIIGITAIPDAKGDYCNSSTGYQLDNNGQHQIKLYLEVEKLSAGPVIIDTIEYTADSGQLVKIQVACLGKLSYAVYLFENGQRKGWNFSTLAQANNQCIRLQS